MLGVQIVGYRKPFRIGSCPTPTPAQGEVLVAVKASGLCSTDLHLRDGQQDLRSLPRIPGHESAGEIAAVGDGVTGWKTGERVLVTIDVTCGQCSDCLTGQTQRCSRLERLGFERDGGHADFEVVPAQNLIPLPPDLRYEDACVLPDATGLHVPQPCYPRADRPESARSHPWCGGTWRSRDSDCPPGRGGGNRDKP